MKSVIIGNITIDRNREDGMGYTGPGGSAYFVSRTLSLFKKPNIIITSYGRDLPRKYLKDMVIYSSRPTARRNLVFYNVTNGRKRIQRIDREGETDLPLTDLPDFLFQNCDSLILAPVLNNIFPENIKDIVAKLPSGCLKVLLGQGLFRRVDKKGYIFKTINRNFEHFLKLVDIVFLSDEDLTSPHKNALLWSLSGKTVIITRAEKGCAVYKNGRREDFSAYPQDKIIDPTGAGDIFAASYTYALFNSMDYRESARFANAAASLSLNCHSDNLCFTIEDVLKIINS